MTATLELPVVEPDVRPGGSEPFPPTPAGGGPRPPPGVRLAAPVPPFNLANKPLPGPRPSGAPPRRAPSPATRKSLLIGGAAPAWVRRAAGREVPPRGGRAMREGGGPPRGAPNGGHTGGPVAWRASRGRGGSPGRGGPLYAPRR